MIKLLFALSILVFVYIIGWHQIYGQFINVFYKKYEMWLIWLSVPSTLLSIYATKLLAEYFNGKMWPNRIFTFSIGIVMFTILTHIYFHKTCDITINALNAISVNVLTLIFSLK